ncbi:hypothetical protein ABZS86_04665 [Streptomyces sp. NPDC005355]|uniref:hypothetical protein n=1 Tax=Streptomyces sp. NPDC005355 TaxID=3157038 RepID=UPI0033B39EDC
MKEGKAWVGERGHDEDTGRDAIVSDVRGGPDVRLSVLDEQFGRHPKGGPA